MRKPIIISILCLLSCMGSVAQQSEIIKKYIATYRDIAIAEEQRTGVPASIKLAQGIHETMAGTSDLVLSSNNHFGIKCKSNWTGQSVYHDDDARGECFRKYPEAGDSYRDHSDFLKNGSRYSFLFELDPLDYKGWANGLKRAGYATNPRYPNIIIKLIEDYRLQDYTLMAMGKMPYNDPIISNLDSVAMANTRNMDESTEEATPETALALSYPTGIFHINDTKVMFAKKGESFLGIAKQNNLPLARIFEFNDMEEAEELDRDQLIFLQRKRKVGRTNYHVVLRGETLRSIAQIEGIRLESLCNYNMLDENMLPMNGEQLYLRSKAPSMPRLASNQEVR